MKRFGSQAARVTKGWIVRKGARDRAGRRRPYSTPSGSSASRLAMYSRSASSTASSIGGGS